MQRRYVAHGAADVSAARDAPDDLQVLGGEEHLCFSGDEVPQWLHAMRVLLGEDPRACKATHFE